MSDAYTPFDAGRSGFASSLNTSRTRFDNGYRHEWTAESFAAMHKVEPSFKCKACNFEFYAKFGPECPLCGKMPVLACNVCKCPLPASEAIYNEELIAHICWGCEQAKLPKLTPFLPSEARAVARAV